MVENNDKKMQISSADLLKNPQGFADDSPAVEPSFAEEYDEDDQVLFLYSQLMNTPFNRTDIISGIERSIYTELSADPEDTLAMITFMQSQIMLGNHPKAKALAYKLWEVGGELEDIEEYIYINALLNLGLLEMASVLLKPKFETLTASIDYYYPLLLKLCTMTGNVYLLERLITHPNAPEDDNDYMQILTRYKNYNYADHFKNVQRIIMENVKESICVYDYDVTGGVMSEIVSEIYVGGDGAVLRQLESSLNEKLNEYYRSANIEKLSNYNWKLLPVSSHPVIGID